MANSRRSTHKTRRASVGRDRRAAAVKRATSRVKTGKSIDFPRAVRGR